MKKMIAFFLMALSVLVAFHSVGAQETKKIRRIGLLSSRFPSAIAARVEAFRQGLRELGYVEGKNIVVEYQYAHGKVDRMPALAAELVSRKVDVIVTLGGNGTRAAKKATKTIPVVMSQDPDPVASGFVTSLAQPGGNITGMSRLTPEIGGKQLELLKEIVPKLSRVAVFGTSSNPINARALKEAELVATEYGLKLQFVDILSFEEIENAFRTASKERANAVLMLSSPVFLSAGKQIAGLAVENRLPTVYDRRAFVEDGGLMSYGTNIEDLARRAATYVDKILKGANPADLPIEQPRKFDLVINLRTAKKLGLTIPPEVLFRATKVIR